MTRTSVGIVSSANDLHALLIQHTLVNSLGIACQIIESDQLFAKPQLSWSNCPGAKPRVPVRTGKSVDLGDLDLIWWRRSNQSQLLPNEFTEPAAVDLINAESRSGLLGILLAEFKGCWVSHPTATMIAEHKIVQMKAAEAAGFRIPRTLVSQNPDDIQAFCRSMGRDVVIKALRGTTKRMLLTQLVSSGNLPSTQSLSVCPAIFQEHVEGTRHLRVQCFGEAVHAVMIESDILDWRRDLRVPIHPIALPTDVEDKLRTVLTMLNLRMGIFDLKYSHAGELFWLELNPQGQFLFLEGICGLSLSQLFASFLVREVARGTGSLPGPSFQS